MIQKNGIDGFLNYVAFLRNYHKRPVLIVSDTISPEAFAKAYSELNKSEVKK